MSDLVKQVLIEYGGEIGDPYAYSSSSIAWTRMGHIILTGVDGIDYGLNANGAVWSASDVYSAELPATSIGIAEPKTSMYASNSYGKRWIKCVLTNPKTILTLCPFSGSYTNDNSIYVVDFPNIVRITLTYVDDSTRVITDQFVKPTLASQRNKIVALFYDIINDNPANLPTISTLQTRLNSDNRLTEITITWSTLDTYCDGYYFRFFNQTLANYRAILIRVDYVFNGLIHHENYFRVNNASEKYNSPESYNGSELWLVGVSGHGIPTSDLSVVYSASNANEAINPPNSAFIPLLSDGFSIYSVMPEITRLIGNGSINLIYTDPVPFIYTGDYTKGHNDGFVVGFALGSEYIDNQVNDQKNADIIADALTYIGLITPHGLNFYQLASVIKCIYQMGLKFGFDQNVDIVDIASLFKITENVLTVTNGSITNPTVDTCLQNIEPIDVKSTNTITSNITIVLN